MSTLTPSQGSRKWNILAIVVLVLLVLVWSRNLRSPPADPLPAQAFFTVDGGKSWFADGFEKLPPFQRDGKQAYRCHVYTCDGGQTKFAGYLERFTQEGKDFIQKEQERTGRFDPANAFMHVEVRRPGAADTGWVKLNSLAGRMVADVRCPKGSAGRPQLVTPDATPS
jgi:hypothetical protein